MYLNLNDKKYKITAHQKIFSQFFHLVYNKAFLKSSILGRSLSTLS